MCQAARKTYPFHMHGSAESWMRLGPNPRPPAFLPQTDGEGPTYCGLTFSSRAGTPARVAVRRRRRKRSKVRTRTYAHSG
jgi:hypothetical protein